MLGEHFINREKELKKLKNYLENQRNVIIYSPRRYGKTSLVRRALAELNELKAEYCCLFIDCYAVISERELAKKLSEQVLMHYPEKEFFEAVKRLFHGLSPKLTIKSIPEVQVEVDYNYEDDWHESFDLPKRLAEDKEMPVIVVFDEFQELGRFKNLLKVLRATFQNHQCVSYVFIGSRRHMMEWIFQSQESPFYNFGAHITLKEIPKPEFPGYIRYAFEESGILFDEKAIEEMLKLTKCHPHFTQRVCFELWYTGRRNGCVKKGDPERVLKEVISDLEDSFISVWDSLSPNQRKALLGIAKDGRDLFSGNFLRENDFKSPASVQSALRKLIERDIVSRSVKQYNVSDVFMEYWLKFRFLS